MDTVVSYVAQNANPTKVCGENPDRVYLSLSWLGPQSFGVWAPNSSVSSQHGVTTASGERIEFEFSKHGKLCTSAWYSFGDMTGGTATVIEVIWAREE